MTSERPNGWVTWLPLDEWWYNTTHHTTIQITPYATLYGQDPPLHQPYLAGSSQVATVDHYLQTSEATRQLLKFHLKRSQARMKQLSNKKRFEREFQVGYMVYLKLQPYRQHSIRRIMNQKLSLKYFGPLPCRGQGRTSDIQIDFPY